MYNYTELVNLLNKRVKYLKKTTNNTDVKNVRIINNSIFFDTSRGINIEDCRFDDVNFYVVGTEGEDAVKLNSVNLFNEIKKQAKDIDCGGLK